MCKRQRWDFSRVHDAAQGRTEVRWHSEQEKNFSPPCASQRPFVSKCTVLKKKLATLLGLFGVPKWFGARELCFPCPPSLHPGVTLREKMRSCEIRRALNIGPLLQIERSQLRWYGHMCPECPTKGWRGNSCWLLLLSQLFQPLLGRIRSRGRCWAAIQMSHCPEPSGRAVHGLDIEGQHGRRFVLLRHTQRPQRRPCAICTDMSGNARHRCGGG